MRIGIDGQPLLRQGIDLCTVCKYWNKECHFIEGIILEINKANPTAEFLVTECRLFAEKDGRSRDRDIRKVT